MAVVYHNSDANLGLITDRTPAILGYGNLGRAFALNLRDSAFPVLVGNQDDEYAQHAYRDGFETLSISEAAQRADLLLITLPDEIAPQIYLETIAPQLKPDTCLIFASGYNVAFGFIEPPPFVDTVLIAPQTVGEAVRQSYVDGSGFASFVAVAQDASGQAWGTVLAVAKALGALQRGGIELSFQQEAELDLFTHQALMPAIHAIVQTAIEVLNREGFPPEAILTALYLSGELGYITRRWSEAGIVPSMDIHALTRRYGTLSRIERFKEVKLTQQMQIILDAIRDGRFAQEWAAEFADGYPRYTALHDRLKALPTWQTEQELLAWRRENADEE